MLKKIEFKKKIDKSKVLLIDGSKNIKKIESKITLVDKSIITCIEGSKII